MFELPGIATNVHQKNNIKDCAVTAHTVELKKITDP